MGSQGGIGPSIGGFNSFITNIMAVPNTATYAEPDVVQWAYNFAINWVNQGLKAVPTFAQVSWTIYAQAVYNLAADTLINWAQDAPDAPTPYPNPVPNQPNIGYWQWLRNKFGVLNFVAGVVESSGDQGTSASYQVPEQFATMTIANLGNLKTPFGRAYLGIAGSWGSVWGLS